MPWRFMQLNLFSTSSLSYQFMRCIGNRPNRTRPPISSAQQYTLEQLHLPMHYNVYYKWLNSQEFYYQLGVTRPKLKKCFWWRVKTMRTSHIFIDIVPPLCSFSASLQEMLILVSLLLTLIDSFSCFILKTTSWIFLPMNELKWVLLLEF